jgi:hypothetical protein
MRRSWEHSVGACGAEGGFTLVWEPAKSTNLSQGLKPTFSSREAYGTPEGMPLRFVLSGGIRDREADSPFDFAQGKDKQKGKCGDLSTARYLTPSSQVRSLGTPVRASVEMTGCGSGWRTRLLVNPIHTRLLCGTSLKGPRRKMNGKHTIFDTRRQGCEDSRNISPSPNRPDESSLSSAFLAERGEKQPPSSSLNLRDTFHGSRREV